MGNNLWRSPPVREICQREENVPTLSVMVKRSRVPSGDHRMKVAAPLGRVASFSGVLPSVSVRYNSWFLAKTIVRPSGDQDASWPIRPPRRREVPLGSETTHRG